MRFAALNPVWVDDERGPAGSAIEFDCPGACCADRHDYSTRVSVSIRNPISGGTLDEEPGFTRIGDDFEILTLIPEVYIGEEHKVRLTVAAGEIAVRSNPGWPE